MHEAWGEDEESSSPSKVSWSHEPQVYHIMGLGNQDEPHDDDGFQRPRGKVLVQGSPIAPCIVLSDYDEGPKAEKEDAENRKFALPDQKRRKCKAFRDTIVLAVNQYIQPPHLLSSYRKQTPESLFLDVYDTPSPSAPQPADITPNLPSHEQSAAQESCESVEPDQELDLELEPHEPQELTELRAVALELMYERELRALYPLIRPQTSHIISDMEPGFIGWPSERRASQVEFNFEVFCKLCDTAKYTIPLSFSFFLEDCCTSGSCLCHDFHSRPVSASSIRTSELWTDCGVSIFNDPRSEIDEMNEHDFHEVLEDRLEDFLSDSSDAAVSLDLRDARIQVLGVSEEAMLRKGAAVEVVKSIIYSKGEFYLEKKPLKKDLENILEKDQRRRFYATSRLGGVVKWCRATFGF